MCITVGTLFPLIKVFFLSEPKCNLMVSLNMKATALLQPGDRGRYDENGQLPHALQSL